MYGRSVIAMVLSPAIQNKYESSQRKSDPPLNARLVGVLWGSFIIIKDGDHFTISHMDETVMTFSSLVSRIQ